MRLWWFTDKSFIHEEERQCLKPCPPCTGKQSWEKSPTLWAGKFLSPPPAQLCFRGPSPAPPAEIQTLSMLWSMEQAGKQPKYWTHQENPWKKPQFLPFFSVCSQCQLLSGSAAAAELKGEDTKSFAWGKVAFLSCCLQQLSKKITGTCQVQTAKTAPASGCWAELPKYSDSSIPTGNKAPKQQQKAELQGNKRICTIPRIKSCMLQFQVVPSGNIHSYKQQRPRNWCLLALKRLMFWHSASNWFATNPSINHVDIVNFDTQNSKRGWGWWEAFLRE